MQIAIAVFLAAMGILVLVYVRRFYRDMMQRAAEFSVREPEPDLMDIEPTTEVHNDGLVYLFGHNFANSASGGIGIGRDKAVDPLTEKELDPGDWARKMWYAAIWELFDGSMIEYRFEHREPSFLPPCPHKPWELQLSQSAPFPTSPIMGALDVAFEMMRSRKQHLVAQGKEEPGQLWCPLDELIERAMKAMRQEISFWERSGLYGDVRNYVASGLVVQGYLSKPEPKTWLDRARSKQPRPNIQQIERLEPAAEKLKSELYQFKLEYGSPYASGTLEPEEGQKQIIPEADPSLASRDSDFDEMPLDDCLRLSIYEALINLKQLEPRSGSGL